MSGGRIERGDESFRIEDFASASVEGGTVESAAVLGTLKIGGGTVASAGVFTNGTVRLSGDGTIDSAGVAGELTMRGGTVGTLTLGGGSVKQGELNLVSGVIAERLTAREGSKANVFGGSTGPHIRVEPGGILNVFGGSFETRFLGLSTSEINLFGRRFWIDGLEVDLAESERLTVTERDVTLEAELLDGSTIDFQLNPVNDGLADYFDPAATLTLTRFDGLPGDYNADGIVDAADYTHWRDSLGADAGTLPNDPTGQPVGDLQHAMWTAYYGSRIEDAAAHDSATIPEPTGAAVVVLLAASALLGCPRRCAPRESPAGSDRFGLFLTRGTTDSDALGRTRLVGAVRFC